MISMNALQNALKIKFQTVKIFVWIAIKIVWKDNVLFQKVIQIALLVEQNMFYQMEDAFAKII